jgi:hypothetical protein
MNAGASAVLDPQSHAFYHRTLVTLQSAEVPFMVGGAYAFAFYTGIERHTKDFDIFVNKQDYERVMRVFSTNNYKTELTFPHWLGKAFDGDNFVDVIFSSGNGVAVVDEEWFEHAIDGKVLEHPVKVCPAEEMIWSKGFIMERERFDGADVAHLIKAQGAQFDWPRLMRRFDRYWRVLFAHLVLFNFIYPNERSQIPSWVMDDLLRRMQEEQAMEPGEEKICRGTFISRQQYLMDIGRWGYRDARVLPEGTMSPEEAIHWTASIGH